MYSIRAGYFSVGVNEPLAKVAEACKAYVNGAPADGIEVTVDQQRYRLTEPAWFDADNVFVATMWRVREKNLPSAIKEGRMVQIGSELAESASFAFIPARSEVLVQYNHHGPRHGIVREFLQAIGLKEPVLLVPVIREGAVQRVKDATVLRRIEYALGDIQDEQTLRGVGLGSVIDQLKGLQGAHIRVEVSLGHHDGGLSDMARNLAIQLSEMTSGVKAVKVGIKEGEDKTVEMLDLLNGRLFIDMNVPEVGREIDRSNCRQRLRDAIRDRLTTSEESEDGDDDDNNGNAAA